MGKVSTVKLVKLLNIDTVYEIAEISNIHIMLLKTIYLTETLCFPHTRLLNYLNQS